MFHRKRYRIVTALVILLLGAALWLSTWRPLSAQQFDQIHSLIRGIAEAIDIHESRSPSAARVEGPLRETGIWIGDNQWSDSSLAWIDPSQIYVNRKQDGSMVITVTTTMTVAGHYSDPSSLQAFIISVRMRPPSLAGLVTGAVAVLWLLAELIALAVMLIVRRRKSAPLGKPLRGL